MDLIVLAGGRGRRMGGAKGGLKLDGVTLVETVIGRLRELFDNVVISSAGGDSFRNVDAIEVADIYPDCGSLGGLHAGLSTVTSPRAFAIACDMPFVNPGLVKLLVSRPGEFEVVVPRIADGKLEPLHAVYSKSCMPHMESLLESGNLRIFDFFDRVRVEYVEVDRITGIDPEMLSFFNVNTPEDLERARMLTAKRRPSDGRTGTADGQLR